MSKLINIKDVATEERGAGMLSCMEMHGETFFRIQSVNTLRPFFMSIVSDSDHWMFIASNGGVSAGRKDADHALFPYYTDDKIIDNAEITGSKTIFQVLTNNEIICWEPFSIRNEGKFRVSRNLYKSRFGNRIIFEEVNHTLKLSFQYEWCTGDLFGFIKKSRLKNLSPDSCHVKLLDGLQNILPDGVGSDLQNRVSNLVDAYKRTELVENSGLAIFSLSAIIVDKAEPSEALKANVAWSLGLQNPVHLLSSQQLQSFRENRIVVQETDVKGERGAYFVASDLTILSSQTKEWIIAANVNMSHAAVVELSEKIIHDESLRLKIEEDVQLGNEKLQKLVATSDGIQYSSDILRDARHYSNVLFNIMRGGIFNDNYNISKKDFEQYLRQANQPVYNEFRNMQQALPEYFTVFELRKITAGIGNPDLTRLSTEYLPLTFSRRHGDPSRPWNRFSINTRNEQDGSVVLDYEGNWRDIFQNWEALAKAYPGFLEGMIAKFLNASTFDGYNPYRIMRDGFDWETIEPDNPWSYIGYWGDHQVIYLLKLLESLYAYKPSAITDQLNQAVYVYAHVPYIIKPYDEIVSDPKNTIVFDREADKDIRIRREITGADAALLYNAKGNIQHVSFLEKMLATLLSRLSNFVPEGGIWMNTQRPEWNDANNALVGNGLSMVTLCYLRRFLKFFEKILLSAAKKNYTISAELSVFFIEILQCLEENKNLLGEAMNNSARKKITDALGRAGSKYRTSIYDKQFSGEQSDVESEKIARLVTLALEFLEHSIRANKREDGLYHAYNLISYSSTEIKISGLSEMLEGQVAVLSSGYLAASESAALLDALTVSKLYREDQHSYMLYPGKSLPGFLVKNTIPKNVILQSALLADHIQKGDKRIVEEDIKGNIHFNGDFRNVQDLEKALLIPGIESALLPEKEKQLITGIYESTFNHKAFTGRSGTFFGYEGLGCIYWHMVSKLLLSVQETCFSAMQEKAGQAITEKLVNHYYSIREGIGVHKSPELYGAYPTDPYSHTPPGKGAQQPGMTGQVKEDILCRIGELGIVVENGQISFKPTILKLDEFSTIEREIEYFDVQSQKQNILLPSGSLFFTCCAVPVMYVMDEQEGMEIFRAGGKTEFYQTAQLSKEDSNAVCERTGELTHIKVLLKSSALIG